MIQKGILEFNLDEPEGREAHRRTIKALELALALSCIQEDVHKKIRHSSDEEEVKHLEKVLNNIHERLDQYGIVLDDLIS